MLFYDSRVVFKYCRAVVRFDTGLVVKGGDNVLKEKLSTFYFYNFAIKNKIQMTSKNFFLNTIFVPKFSSPFFKSPTDDDDDLPKWANQIAITIISAAV